jgi:uncharacterized lipoprotein YddW (UPF0748 family)
MLPLLAVLLALAAPAPPATDVRGLWVVRTALVSPEAIEDTVARAQAAGVNTLFVQVRGRGDAFYRSTLVPRSVLLERQPAEFDPLAQILAAAHARGMTVHAWVNVLIAAGRGQPLPRGHVLLRHPEWAMVPRAVSREAALRSGPRILALVEQAAPAESEGLYLAPSAPGVGDHLEAVTRELLSTYPLDGLHLDFIRLPGPEYDYSRWALAGFRTQGGSDVPAVAARDPRFGDYRRASVTALVDRLAHAARDTRPGLLVSAAVVPDIVQATTARFQDWPAWLDSGALDVACPMAYSADDRVFTGQLRAARSLLGPARVLWAGVGAYRLDVPGVLHKVQLARASGADGFVLFSHEWLAGEDPRRLREDEADGSMTAAAGR